MYRCGFYISVSTAVSVLCANNRQILQAARELASCSAYDHSCLVLK